MATHQLPKLVVVENFSAPQIKDAVQGRRDKMAEAITNQIAYLNNPEHRIEKKGYKVEKDEGGAKILGDDGKAKRQRVTKHMKPRNWFRVQTDGRLVLTPLYGRAALYQDKGGKPQGFVVENREALPEVLTALLEAVTTGKLDSELKRAAVPFGKKAKVKKN